MLKVKSRGQALSLHLDLHMEPRTNERFRICNHEPPIQRWFTADRDAIRPKRLCQCIDERIPELSQCLGLGF